MGADGRKAEERLEGRRQQADVRSQRSEGGRQMTEDRDQRTEVVAREARWTRGAINGKRTVCAQCGADWIEDSIVAQLENIVDDARKKHLMVEVTSMAI
jgi:hypothetical protein